MAKLKELKENIQTFQSQIEKSETMAASKDKIEKEYNKLNGDISFIEKRFFSSTEQEHIIVLLNEMLNDTVLEVSSIDFSEIREEKIKNYTVDAITVHLPFKGSYDALLSFMKKIREYEKKIIVNGLHIENSQDGNLSGAIYLDFYSLPNTSNDDYLKKYFTSGETGKENPFSPFDGFIWEDDDFTEDYIQASTVEEQVSYNKVLLNGFEKLNTFFVGTPKKVFGKISRDINSKEGKYALKLEYDFLRPREHSQANVVYEGTKALISKQAESIGIWAYAFEKSDHKIGIALKDSKGKIYTILLANQIDWIGWNNIESGMPIEIAYPVEIQRIYVESVNYDNKTKGTLLFDRLEATYPKVLLYNADNMNSSNKKFISHDTKDIVYKVQSGDTIFSIAKKFYNDYTKRGLITQYNNILDAENIFVGQILRIPNVNGNQDNSKTNEITPKDSEAIQYTVQPNDTIFSISKKFYGDYDKRNLIIEYNNIKDPTNIRAGQVLYIPKTQ